MEPNLQRKQSLPHDTDRALSNWTHTREKVKAVGFFARHMQDKCYRRDNLVKFMKRMNSTLRKDAPELKQIREEYEQTQPNSIQTMRPRSPTSLHRPVPTADGPTWKSLEIQAGSKCALCDETFPTLHEREAYPCRVCDDVFHRTCLEECRDLQKADKINIPRAKTNTGWSCPSCANISLLLNTDEVKALTYRFEDIDFNEDSQITLDEYKKYHTRCRKDKEEPAMNEDEEKQLAIDYRLMDQDGDGKLDWWEFVNHEAKSYLLKKDKHDLVDMLTAKELSAARATFNVLDKDRDGKIKTSEAREFYHRWYNQFETNDDQDGVAKESDVLDHHTSVSTRVLMEADPNDNGEVKWEEFILNQAIYIITSRPNINTNVYGKRN